MGLRADVKDFSPTEIAYLVAKYGKTGKMMVNSSDSQGEIFFQNGRIVHATLGETVGVEALYRIGLFTDGEIVFENGVSAPEVTIEESASTLMEEMERRRVEIKELQAKLPPFDTVLVRCCAPAEEGNISLRKTDWKVLVLIDGKRTIEEIIRDSKLGVLEAMQSLTWLLEKGMALDPNEGRRTLEYYVEILDKLLSELGFWGRTEGKEELEEIFKRADKTGGVVGCLSFEGARVSVVKPDEVTVSKNEIRNVFLQVFQELYEKTIENLGKILARKKFNDVLKGTDVKVG